MPDWTLSYEGFEPAQEGLREALCTLGNGYFATRGAAPEAGADDVHYPGTYLAGGYNRLRSEVAGRVVENEDLVNCPNWLPLTFRAAGGEWFHPGRLELLDYRQVLHVERGVLSRELRCRDGQGRVTRVTHRRLVHMGQPHLAALETVVTPENWSGSLEVRSALDGRVTNSGVARYRGLANRHLEPLDSGVAAPETLALRVRTTQSRIEIAQAARTRAYRNGRPVDAERREHREPGYIAQTLALEAREGEPVRLEKVVALFSSRDHAISEAGLEAGKAVGRAGDFAELEAAHALAWSQLWRRFDIALELEDGEESLYTACILRVHTFHLLQVASPHIMDYDAGVPARGLHGEAYRGHIFWDELYIFPFLNWRMPEITRSLLQYRYRRLGEARALARSEGYRGAMYPWQSGSNGREESQRLHLNPRSGRWIPDHTRLQRHVNAAIAYNIWQYYQVTGDLEFLSFYGAETFLEIARFWASAATYNPELQRYEIHGVVGPDEYHDGYPGADAPGLNNHAYTNVMAAWVLHRALELLTLLTRERREELSEFLHLGLAELERWEEISRRMRVIIGPDGIIEQFEGYGALQEFDWEGYRRKYGDIQRLDRILEAEGDDPNRYKASKQADVLMLFYLFSAEELGTLFAHLGYAFEAEMIPRNIEYYLRRTSHGSTLSSVAHAWVTARADRPGSWRLFGRALRSDVEDVQGGTTPEGIHLGAMAGTVDILQRAYTGIEPRGGILRLNPHLPDTMHCLRMAVRYRGHPLEVEVTRDTLCITPQESSATPIRIAYGDQVREISNGGPCRFRR